MTQDEIKAGIAAELATKIAELKKEIEQMELPPFWASEGSRAYHQHKLWVYLHLRILDWEDVQNILEEYEKRGGVDFDETWRATVRYRHEDIREALEHHDMEQLHDALVQLYGEKAASYDIQLKRNPGQRLPPSRDRKMEKAVTDVALIRELWEREYHQQNREEGDCLRAERLSADYHGVHYETLLSRIKNKNRS